MRFYIFLLHFTPLLAKPELEHISDLMGWEELVNVLGMWAGMDDDNSSGEAILRAIPALG